MEFWDCELFYDRVKLDVIAQVGMIQVNYCREKCYCTEHYCNSFVFNFVEFTNDFFKFFELTVSQCP